MNVVKSDMLDTFDHVEIYAAAAELDSGSSLKSAMLSMPGKLGLKDMSSAEAEDMASQITRFVGRYEAARDGISCDLIGSVNKFLESMDSYTTRERFMKGILRGLDMSENGLNPEIFDGKSGSAAYEEIFGCDDKYENMPYSNLRTEFMTRLGQLNFSSKAIDRMLRELKKSPDFVASAAAFGREGYELKCLTAMHLCLTRIDMTPWEASINACLGTDIQAVGDAVRLGRVTAEAAGVLMNGCVIAAVLVGGALFVACDSLSALAFAWASISLMGLSLYWLYYNLPEAAGKGAIWLSHFIHRGSASIAEGWQKIRDRLEQRNDYACCENDTDCDEEELGARLDSPF